MRCGPRQADSPIEADLWPIAACIRARGRFAVPKGAAGTLAAVGTLPSVVIDIASK
jgi:hypothetical protein